MTNHNRKPAGRPDGGEFTSRERVEADVELMEFALDDIFLSTVTSDSDDWITDEEWERREKARISGLREEAQGKMFPEVGESEFEGVPKSPEIRGDLGFVFAPQQGPEVSGPFLFN